MFESESTSFVSFGFAPIPAIVQPDSNTGKDRSACGLDGLQASGWELELRAMDL